MTIDAKKWQSPILTKFDSFLPKFGQKGAGEQGIFYFFENGLIFSPKHNAKWKFFDCLTCHNKPYAW